MAVPSKPASLMELPTELRLNILERLLLSPTPTILDRQKDIVYPGVLQVCRRVYEEGKPILARNILRYSSVQVMVSRRPPVSQMIKHVELDLIPFESLDDVDEQTCSELPGPWLATILTPPGHIVGRYFYCRSNALRWKRFARLRSRAQKLWQSPGITYIRSCGDWQYDETFDRWFEAEPLALKTFTLNVGPSFASWILSLPVSKYLIQAAPKAEPLLLLLKPISIGLRHAEDVVISGRGARHLQPLWDALVSGDSSMLETEEMKAVFEYTRAQPEWTRLRCLRCSVTFTG